MAPPLTQEKSRHADADVSLGRDAEEICQTLLRFDTTNPPGNERAAAEYLEAKLSEVGYEAAILESAPRRANLVCRWRGRGEGKPLLLTAHLDVVEARGEEWRYPPFSGAIAEGCLWGRGAIDMKHMAAMSAAVMRRLARQQVSLARDVIFAAVADEEMSCAYGSQWLAQHHPELVRAEYALGECGGFSVHVGPSTFYPVQVAEKGFCWIRARARGPSGHGSMPRRDSAIVKLGEAVARLGKVDLPIHPNRYVRDFLAAIASRQPKWAEPLLRLLTHPRLLPAALRLVPNDSVRRGLRAALSNTASPTAVSAGSKINVIPGAAEVQIDARFLPGQTRRGLLEELAAVLGPDIELEVLESGDPVVTEPIESPLFTAIRRHVERRDPGATVVPYLMPGNTDARNFASLGARWYGFSPLKIDRDADIRFADLFHGPNERVPIAGLHWGAEVLYDVVTDFCRQP